MEQGGAPGNYYHAFLLVFRPSSPIPVVFRAGPSVGNNPDAASDLSKDVSGAPNNQMLGFGYLITGGCVNVPWTAAENCDYPHPGNPNDDVAKMTIPTITPLTPDLLILQLTAAAHKIDSLVLPYHPASQNSNSFVHTLIKHSRLGDPTPPVNVPGWDHILY